MKKTMFPGLRAAKSIKLVIKKVVTTQEMFMSCDIHLDGARMGSFVNDGNGGCGRFVMINSARDQLFSALIAGSVPGLPDLGESDPPNSFEFTPGSHDHAESVFANLIGETQALKAIKRQCKNHILIVFHSSDPCGYSAYKMPFNERSKQAAIEKFGDTIAHFLNEDILTV